MLRNLILIKECQILKLPLPYFMGIEIVDTKRKRQIFRSLSGLEVDSPLPAVGLSKPKGELRTMSDVRPGVAEDKIVIKLFQASSDAEGTRSKLNKLVD